MSAHGAGKAYAIGLMMGLMSKGLTYDEAKWVTLPPAGKGTKASGEGNKKGRPCFRWFKPLPQMVQTLIAG